MTILPIIFESSSSPETIKGSLRWIKWINLAPSNIFKLRQNNSRVTKDRSTTPQSSAGSSGAVLPRKKPERCNLDHRSVECGGNLTHRIGSELILDNWCRANVRLFEKEKGLRLPIRSQSRGLSRASAVPDFRQGALPPEAPLTSD
jgi:hypothetical protein